MVFKLIVLMILYIKYKIIKNKRKLYLINNSETMNESSIRKLILVKINMSASNSG